MSIELPRKVEARHLKRNAYLYVRQSSLHQVFENTESTRRQYDLRGRATALGWPAEQIVVIDSDQGQSGATASDRAGFQRLMTEVSMARAGIVMGLEVSRLARNSADWHRLLEICALADTLILDEDGIYNPAHFNDRLLLGLKGSMSEAELHVMRARLRGGILNQARRGALKAALPVGFEYDEEQQVRLDPDRRVQEAIRLLFRTFRRTGTALSVVRSFHDQGLSFPRRPQHGPREGHVLWSELGHRRVLHILRNPRYAGAFFFGSTRRRKYPDGRTRSVLLPREEWVALIPDSHEGYISWEEFEENQRRIAENAPSRGPDRKSGPPREGSALLQGLAVCGRCGRRMSVRYHVRRGRQIPDYTCARRAVAHAEPVCQVINGEGIDEAIARLLIETVSPISLEVSVAVQQELEARAEEADRLRQQAVESARYEAELSRRRYMRVDPDRRLVADALEAEWNEKLRALTEAQENYQRERQAHREQLDDEKRARIMELAQDFPRLWMDPRTPHRERKRMARLLIEDVTLVKDKEITAHVRFKGGATRTLRISLPPPGWMHRQTPPEVVAEIDRLLDEHTEGEIAELLNQQGAVSGMGGPFKSNIVRNIRVAYGLKTRYQRLRERGMLDVKEIAERLDVHPVTLNRWRRCGFLVGVRYNDKNECLYMPPGEESPVKGKHHKQSVSEAHATNSLRM